MTPFTERIVEAVLSIPPGRVATYGEVAALAGSRRGARQVARVLHSLSGSRKLPWHRVVGAGGYIRLPEGGGREEQAALLASEGVEVDAAWRVSLKR
jgi:methylated-DNA-protein-cysteine methyltransferase-like protein